MFTDKQPIYMQLYEKIKKEIIDGVYVYGSKMPSKRVIAERYGISLITVEHTISLLCDEGYLEPKERSGYYVVFKRDEIFSGAERIEPTIIKREYAVNELPITIRNEFPFSVYAKIMRRVLGEYGESLMEPVPGMGAPVLREAISSYLARSRGIRVDAERIVIGSGSEYLYGLIVQLFGRDKVIAIENPGYKKIELVYKASGAILEYLPLGQDGIKTEALNASRAQALHITPYRSFPTGISTNASKRHEYIRWAKRNQSYIIEDDFESEFSPSSKPEETVFSLDSDDNVIYMNSFTQTIAPSIRISYLVLPKSLINVFEERLGFYKCTVPSFEQYVLAEFINDGEFERHLNRVRRRMRTER